MLHKTTHGNSSAMFRYSWATKKIVAGGLMGIQSLAKEIIPAEKTGQEFIPEKYQ